MRTSRWAWSSIPCRWPTSRFSWSFISSVSLLCSERKYCVLINVQLISRLLIVIKIHERWNWSRSEEDFGLGFPNCSLSPAVGNNFPDVYHSWHELRILSRTRQICYRGGVIEELISLNTKIQFAWPWFLPCSITHEQSLVKSSGQNDQYPFGWRVFSAWDFLITERETAENKLASLTTAIKVSLSSNLLVKLNSFLTKSRYKLYLCLKT